MKLTKQEEVLLSKSPLEFGIYAYLCLYPNTSKRELAGLTKYSPSKCYQLIQQYSKKTTEKTEEITSKKTSAKHDQQRASDRPKTTEKTTIITTQATETTRDKGLHQAFVRTFDEYYKHITRYSYNWDAKAMGGIKQLIRKITSDTEAVNPTASPEEIANNFKMFLSIISDNWILDNLSPTLINSKYNEIKATYGRAKQGNNTNTKHDVRTNWEAFRSAIKEGKR